MRILIVSQYFWPENFRINDLCSGLLERGHRVTVLTGIPNYPDGAFFPGYGFFRNLRQEYHGAEIRRVPLVPRGRGGGARLATNYLSFALSACLLSPLLLRGEFDLIFVFEPSPVTVGLPALLLKRLKSVPILFWVQDLWPESLSATGAVRSPLVLALVKRLVGFIYRGCDRVLTASRAYFPSVQGYGVASERVSYFPQFVESVYRPVKVEPDAPERAIMPEGFRVVFAGNMGAAQSFGTILDAAQKTATIGAIKWVIIGDGRMRGWVEGEIRKRGLAETVLLLGRHPVESMPRFLALADVLLVSLRKDPIFTLTIPGKVQSCLACGRPVIAALDGEGSRLIEEAGAGLTCPAEDAGAMADAVLAMYRMPRELREEMGNNGRSYHVANFAREMLLDRLERWMSEACGAGAEGENSNGE